MITPDRRLQQGPPLRRLAGLALVAIALSPVPILAQDGHDHGEHDKSAASDADSAEHPDRAVCRVCEVRDAAHGAESVAAHRSYHGTHYYFCSEGCAEAFDGFPDAYVAHPLPRPAPGATLTTLDGESLDVEAHEGPLLLVDFWATWCKPCVQAMPELARLQERHDGELRVIGVSIDEKGEEHVRKFLEERPAGYAVAIDSPTTPAWHAFAVAAIPAMFLVDGDGRIVGEWRGAVDMDEVSARVAELLDES